MLDNQTLQAPATLGTRNMRLLTWFETEFLSRTADFGGMYNAHAHLCRADTLEPANLAHYGTTPIDASVLPLSAKQNLVGELHEGPAYIRENLIERGSLFIERMIAQGITSFDTNVDATPDLKPEPLLVIRVGLELKAKYADRIKIRIAPTPIFGFKIGTPRWDVYKEAAGHCDFLSLLPEKDDFVGPHNPEMRLGFKRHIRDGLELACRLGVEAQFHLDQENTPTENGTERFLDVLEVIDQPKLEGASPTVWVIHMISPSCYSEERFARLLVRLREHNVGVIVCPSAALSMRQIRSLSGPTHNSIARMLELVCFGVPVRLGTDNVSDVFVPPGNGDMLTEVLMGAQALRLNQPWIWAKLACGRPLNKVDIATVRNVVAQDYDACRRHNGREWRGALELLEA